MMTHVEETIHQNIFEETTPHRPDRSWRWWLIGRPLATADAEDQTIGKIVGLAVFSSDAMSSVAYGPQEMLTMLLLAGTAALSYGFPIAIVIVALLGILTFSYEQTIHAYKGGGGAYIVARDNLGELPAQIAGAALLTDYILTVAVSVSSGADQIISAFPEVLPYKVEMVVGLILLIMLINLRGVRESGITFAIPTCFFLIAMFAAVITGFIRLLTGTLGPLVEPPAAHIGTEALSIVILLRAFANGTTSLTGVEAISNGIPAFKEPKSHNAGITLIWMSVILGALLLGITSLAIHIGVLPSHEETIISQLVRTIYGGRNFIYLLTIISTTLILVMAANTSFAGFPRLGALIASDGYLPRQLSYRGSRLVFSTGIVTLALIASALIVAFQAEVSRLVPLYAIGVFLSFTLSQTGMARRWFKSGRMEPGEEISEPGSVLRHDKGWRHKMIINSIGAVSTLFVTIIFAIFKFEEGAYVILFLIPVLVLVFYSIHRHYKNLARQLSLEKNPPRMRDIQRNRVIIPIAGVHRGTLEALRFARTLSDDVTAVHISVDENEKEKVMERWAKWGEGMRLIILHSPYRLFLEPLLDYLDKLERVTKPNEIITIVVPQFVPQSRITGFLHMRAAEALRKELLHRENIVITEVPYQVM